MVSEKKSNLTLPAWSGAELWAFRFLSIFIVIQVFPLDYKFYQYLFSFNWFQVDYEQIFTIAKYVPVVFQQTESYYDWILFVIIALVGSVVWSYRHTKAREYNFLYYLLLGITRYRLAAAVFAFGFLKLFVLFAPELSLSTLNTRYGEFTDWKIFSITLAGAKPYYQMFLGFVEILSGLLLLNRKTASIGALIVLSFLGNVFLSNLAYGGQEYVYSSYLLVLAFFVLSRDALRLYRLLFLEVAATPYKYNPVFRPKHIPLLINAAKYIFFFIFIILLGAKSYAGYLGNSYQVPNEAGLSDSRGIYNVRVFVINNDTIPYSTTDSLRWRDVVFEKWPTISIRLNQPAKVDSLRKEYFASSAADRIYESAETNGRFYYAYSADTVGKTLSLHNKNKNYRGQKLFFKYTRQDTTTIVLDGVNENNDTLHVELDKVNKSYLLKLGRGKPLKL
jgi:hypothetical protein